MSVKQKILIVDDEPTNIAILENILEGKYHITAVSSGEQALEVVSDFRPDIVLLDVMMPGLDGYEVCQRIKQDKRLRFTKKILVSAKAMLDERLKGYEFGADDYITKPFDDKELLAKVEVFLKLKFAEEVDQLKSELLCLISHEIRTPLNSILGYSSLLSRSQSLKKEERSHLEIIIDNGNQLLELSHKALLLSELKAGMALIFKPYCIETLINGVIRDLHKKSIKAQVVVVFDSRVEEKFEFDPVLLKHATTFVLENAIKFSPPYSEVFIAARICDEHCVIEIKDKGKGVDEEKIGQIFNEFALDDLPHHKEGQGLSLALAKNIVELHGGDISVLNNENNGASFIFKIPISQNDI